MGCVVLVRLPGLDKKIANSIYHLSKKAMVMVAFKYACVALVSMTSAR